MPDTALNPMLSAKRVNELVAQQMDRYIELVTLGATNAWQDGYLVGDIPPENEEEELAFLRQQAPVAAALLANPQAPEGDRVRAQKALIRLAELERKLFGVQS